MQKEEGRREERQEPDTGSVKAHQEKKSNKISQAIYMEAR